MEAEPSNKSSFSRNIYIVLSILLASFLFYYTVMVMVSSGRKVQSMKEELTSGKNEKSKVDERIYNDTAYLRLLKEKSFLQSRLIMAESDSIYLAISLPDSTINVEISGVSVHKIKMSSVKASKILMKGNEHLILSKLATPLTIANALSTIKKEPVMIKMAPKDTSEFKPDVMPDTSFTEPVNYILEMTDGSRIFVYQDEDEDFSDRLNIFTFDLKYRLNDLWISLKDAIRFKVPEYHPFIRIRLPRSDAKIIYRAVPKNGQVGIYR